MLLEDQDTEESRLQARKMQISLENNVDAGPSVRSTACTLLSMSEQTDGHVVPALLWAQRGVMFAAKHVSEGGDPEQYTFAQRRLEAAQYHEALTKLMKTTKQQIRHRSTPERVETPPIRSNPYRQAQFMGVVGFEGDGVIQALDEAKDTVDAALMSTVTHLEQELRHLSKAYPSMEHVPEEILRTTGDGLEICPCWTCYGRRLKQCKKGSRPCDLAAAESIDEYDWMVRNAE